VTSPVALFVFNRPETARRVFQVIAQYRPATLLVVADGPRNAAEKVRCDETRRVIEAVDWDCRVLTNFSETNLGCRRRMSSGISWVFEQCEQAIILEDDCLPDLSFFRFCEELLIHYKDDERVGLISGFNCGVACEDEVSYAFSRSVSVWGWAAWRRSWSRYDLTMKDWPRLRNTNWLTDLLGTPAFTPQWTNIFDRVHAGKVDTWDYQWVFSCLHQRMLSIVPTRNLIQNIGFDLDATHTTSADNPLAQVAAVSMPFPLRHPTSVAPDPALQTRIFEMQVGSTVPPPIPILPVRAINKARRVFSAAAKSARGRLRSGQSR
jgi:hypothetical protein